jgi:hypothetical protein
MKVKKLKAENFKRLHRVEIEAGAMVVKICGGNDQGKSSLLDSVAAALGGGKLCPEMPIRTGETKGMVSVELDDGMIAERRWEKWKDGTIHTSLEVRAGDGRTLQKPQTVLDRLLGSLSFDPEVFANAKPEKRLELTRAVMKLDLSAFDTKRAQLYADRTEIGRERDAAKAMLLELSTITGPTERVDVSALVKKQEAIAANNRERARIMDAADTAKRKRNEAEDAVGKARVALEDAQRKLNAELSALGAAIEAEKAANFDAKMAPPEQTAVSLADEIAKATAHNEAVAARERQLADQAKQQKIFNESDAKYKAHSADIDAIDAEKLRAIAEAKPPLPGFGFSDTDVTFNGVPFSQASQSERIEVSTAMACCLNPELKIIMVRNASLLDDASQGALERVAAKYGCQCWLEFVGSKSGALVIRDGEVVNGA